MPGPRFDGWHHTRFEGNPGAGKQYLPLARKVLGAVIEEARTAGVGTLKRVHRPGGGVEIVAEVHGSQPRVTIRTGLEETSEQRVRLGDFVVTAKDTARPAGIDGEHPEQILKAEWTTFFFDQDIAGYDDFGRRKGTYRYGDGGVEQFPDGIRHAGNVDWRGAGGERISWYGPACRYWFDRWRQPSAQYGRFVFLLGQVLLDVDAYCAAADVDFSERLVLGAALDGASLLVVQAAIDDIGIDSVPIGRAGDVFLSRPYSDSAIALRLVRYQLLVDETEPQPLRLFVDVGSHQTLWTGSGEGWLSPWFFNQEATIAESFALPVDPFFHQYGFEDGSYDYRRPSEDSEHLVLTVSAASAALAVQACTLPMNQAEAFAPVAADYDYRGNRVQLEFGYRAFGPLPVYDPMYEREAITGTSPWANYILRANGREVPVFDSLGVVGVFEQWRWRRVVTMDLRYRTFAMIENRQGDDWQFTASLRLDSSRADLTDSVVLSTTQIINGGPPPNTGWHALCHFAGQSHIAPLCMLVGALLIGLEGEFVGPGYYQDLGFSHVWYLPAPAQVFGKVAFYSPDNGAILISELALADLCQATHWNSRADAHGHALPVGFAVGEDHLLYSGPGWFSEFVDGDFGGADYVTGDDLGSLTGVAGVDRSYHPIWVLGEIPAIAKG